MAAPRVLNAFRHQWNLHPLELARPVSFARCSTPFGINGIFTRAPAKTPRQRHRVLNAFRHQWNLHLRHPKCCQPRPSLVLNAFRHQWNLHRAGYALQWRLPGVLNAFRHQWNLHIRRWFVFLAALFVLNAFRHQWNLHMPHNSRILIR